MGGAKSHQSSSQPYPSLPSVEVDIHEKRVRFVLAHTVYFAAISYFFWKTGFQENERKSDEGMRRRRNDIARITEETGSGP